MMDAWQNGRDFFGHKSYPRPYIYLSGDRSLAGVERTFRRIGYNPKDFSLIAPRGGDRKLPLLTLLKKLKKDNPSVEVFFIEGFGSKVPKGKLNDYDVVANWLLDLQEFCESEQVTLIGIVHSAKTKEGESYQDPRQRALGSVAWAAYTETMIYIEQTKPDHPEDSTRQIMFLERNSKPEVYKMEFSHDGYLIPMTSSKGNKKTFLDYLDARTLGDEFSLADIKDKTHLSDSSARAEVNKAVKSGLIERTTHGKYTKSLKVEVVKDDLTSLTPTE
jgi:hypothetical protein